MSECNEGRIDLEEVDIESVCRKKFSENKITVTMIYKS